MRRWEEGLREEEKGTMERGFEYRGQDAEAMFSKER